MTVLGVSVGTSAVRLARPVHGLRAGVAASFRHRAIDTTFDQAEQLAAESIGVILADPADPESISATGVAYRDDAQAGAVARAMARQHIVNYRLVPEVHAAIRFLQSTGDLDGLHVVGLYDLGSSGLSVTIVDLDSGRVLASERSFAVSGNMFDATIRDSQIGRQQSTLDDVDGREFEMRCRVAKEQLSTSGAVCLPGVGGLILLSREAFEQMVTVPVEQSARLTREVIARAGMSVDALVMIGGGSRIPLVRATLARWVGLPTITPAEPELVAAKGAALSATPVEDAVGPPTSGPLPVPPVQRAPEPPVQRAPEPPVQRAPEPAAPPVPAPVPVPEAALSAPSAETQAYSDVGSREHLVSDRAPEDTEHERRSRPDVADPRASETPSWLSGTGSAARESRMPRPRLPLLAALGLAVVAAIGLALGYGSTPSSSTADVTPAEQTSTSEATTTVPPTTRRTTTTPPPATTTTVAPAPVEQAPAQVEDVPAPAAPAPAPAPPTIPGLPGVQLPPGITIPPGLIPGL